MITVAIVTAEAQEGKTYKDFPQGMVLYSRFGAARQTCTKNDQRMIRENFRHRLCRYKSHEFQTHKGRIVCRVTA